MKNTLRSMLAVGTLLTASFALTQVVATAVNGQVGNGENPKATNTVETTEKTASSSERTVDNLEKTVANPEATRDKKAVKSTATNSGGMKFQATTYCLRGKTASGTGVRRGIIAADPRILPLGTRVQISAGAYSGTYLVADTGGVIKGRIIDIWVPSCGEARQFGRRTVYVTRLGKK